MREEGFDKNEGDKQTSVPTHKLSKNACLEKMPSVVQ